MTPVVHLRRWIRRMRWHGDTDTLPPALGWAVRHRNEAGWLLALALFACACSALATIYAMVDEQAFTGWALIALLLGAIFVANILGHLLIEAAAWTASWAVGAVRRWRAP